MKSPVEVPPVNESSGRPDSVLSDSPGGLSISPRVWRDRIVELGPHPHKPPPGSSPIDGLLLRLDPVEVGALVDCPGDEGILEALRDRHGLSEQHLPVLALGAELLGLCVKFARECPLRPLRERELLLPWLREAQKAGSDSSCV